MIRVALIALVFLSACQRDKSAFLFDGIDFRANTDSTRGDRHAFTTTVRDAAQNVAAAQRAGRYSGTEYCVRKFGASEIDWSEASAADPATLALTERGELVLTGRCAAR